MSTRGVRLLPETGGLRSVTGLVDRQTGPTCGFEAVENVIQMFRPAANSLSSTHLIGMASRIQALTLTAQGPCLATSGYLPLLAKFGIASTWHLFNHQVLLNALHEDRIAIAVVDAHQIDSDTYPEAGSFHAVVVTNIALNSNQEQVVGYVGVDSNHPGSERVWEANAMAWGASLVQRGSLLITNKPARWHNKAPYYVPLRSGEFVPRW